MHFTVSDYVLDIIHNSLEAGSPCTIVEIVEDDAELAVSVADTGKGMDSEELARARDPFYSNGLKHPGRRFGLGLAFVAQAAEAAGGSFDIDSRKGEGTSVFFSFDRRNVDCPPMGDIAAALRQAFAVPGDHELVVHRRLRERAYSVKLTELRQALGEMETAASLGLLDMFLRSQEEAIQTS